MATKRRNRQTGTWISVDNGDDFSWLLICEDHDRCCEFPTLVEARAFAASPIDWCQDCASAKVAP